MNFSAVSSGRLRYPRATPSPPIYNSPATPTGSGCRWPSSTYVLVFPMGRPMGTGPSPTPTGYTVDQIVVSVGPYMFHTVGLLLDSALASSRGKASPPHRILRSWLPS